MEMVAELALLLDGRLARYNFDETRFGHLQDKYNFTETHFKINIARWNLMVLSIYVKGIENSRPRFSDLFIFLKKNWEIFMIKKHNSSSKLGDTIIGQQDGE